MSTEVTVVGNLASDAELRYTPSGDPVCGFTVAVNSRKKQGDKWVDGEASFFTCSAWGQLGENCSASLEKGQRVIVKGVIEQRSWETPDGERRTAYNVKAYEVGPSLKWATAQVQKNERNNRSVSTQQVADSFGAPPPDDDSRPF